MTDKDSQNDKVQEAYDNFMEQSNDLLQKLVKKQTAHSDDERWFLEEAIKLTQQQRAFVHKMSSVYDFSDIGLQTDVVKDSNELLSLLQSQIIAIGNMMIYPTKDRDKIMEEMV